MTWISSPASRSAEPGRCAAPRAGLLVLVAVGCSSASPAPGPDALGRMSDFAPHPALSPDQVVRIQMEALKHNDEGDRGIEITFRFASPANKRTTGPLSRFARMMRNDQYRPMLNYRSASYGPLLLSEDSATQRVTIVDAGGRVVRYVFMLRRLTTTSCAGCWFTATVIAEPFQQAAASSDERPPGPGP